MTDNNFSTETIIRVYDDNDGYFYEIGPDPDGLGCIDVRYSDGDGKVKSLGLTVPPELARLIAKAMVEIATKMETTKS